MFITSANPLVDVSVKKFEPCSTFNEGLKIGNLFILFFGVFKLMLKFFIEAYIECVGIYIYGRYLKKLENQHCNYKNCKLNLTLY